jgi:hypothetical protein
VHGPGIVIGVFIDYCCVAVGVEVAHWLISATWEWFREDEGVEFWLWILEATELPPWAEPLLPASLETHPLLWESC